MGEANNYKAIWIIYDRDMQILIYYGKKIFKNLTQQMKGEKKKSFSF